MLVQTLHHLQLQYVLLIENLDDKSVKKKKKSILDKMILQWNIAVKLEHRYLFLTKTPLKKKKKTLYHLTSETLSSRHHNWFRIRTRDLFKATFGKTVVLLAWYQKQENN